MIKQAFYKRILKKIKFSKELSKATKELLYGVGGGTAITALIGGSILAQHSATRDRLLPKGMLQ